MKEPFDPYRKWLGILPQDQPPHHYRLLGIELFEADSDVITSAADGRLAQVKRFQTGQHQSLCQQLLNEIAAAKVCLLSADRRVAYDETLRQRLVAEKKPPKAVPAPRKPLAETAGPVVQISVQTARDAAIAIPAAGLTGMLGQRWKLLAIVGAAALIIVAGAAIALNWGGSTSVAEQTKSPRDQTAPSVPAGLKPKQVDSAPGSAVDKTKVKLEEGTGDTTPAPPVAPRSLGDLLNDPAAEKPSTPPGHEKVPAKPAPEKPKPAAPRGESSETPQPKTPRKPAAPDNDAQRAAERKIREVFEKDIAAAKTAEARLALAAKLQIQADQSADDLVVHYTLLRMAMEYAAQGGDLRQAMNVVDVIAHAYDVDPLFMKASLLDDAVKATRTGPPDSAELAQLIETASQLSDTASQNDDFDMAERLLKLATSAARRNRDLSTQRELTLKEGDLKRRKSRFTAVKKSLDALVTDPANSDANLEVGRWYCFVKSEWEKGLPFVAKGSDAELAKLAQRDMANPADGTEEAALATAWLDLAGKEKDSLARRFLQSRAATWYLESLPKLKGLEKVGVEKRLNELSMLDVVSKAGRGGALEKGNVALASNGATVTGISSGAEKLLDGNSTRYDGNHELAFSPVPCEWTVTLPKPYHLKVIRLLLFDLDANRFFRYTVAVSADGKNFSPLADRSTGEWRGWQEITCDKVVRAIRINGLYDSWKISFYAVELEAYCFVPSAPTRAPAVSSVKK